MKILCVIKERKNVEDTEHKDTTANGVSVHLLYRHNTTKEAVKHRLLPHTVCATLRPSSIHANGVYMIKRTKVSDSVNYNKTGVYDVVIDKTKYTVCAFKEPSGEVYKQAFAHKVYGKQGAKHKAQQYFNQYLASCAEAQLYC